MKINNIDQKRNIAKQAIEILENIYPDATCSLDYKEPYQLLIATRLAAQCTDARVNTVTPTLFSTFPSVKDLADAPIEALEKIVYPCGFYRTKAKDIKEMCQMLVNDYNCVVPDTMEELLKLSGIGRKTANLIIGDVYHKPAIVCDTHCIRITNMLGLSEGKNPEKVEKQLWEILPPEKANNFCHRLVMHGRDTCISGRPKCDNCPLNNICEAYLQK